MAAGRGRAATAATLWPHNEGLDVFQFGGSGQGILARQPDRWEVAPGLPLSLPTEANIPSLVSFL